MQILPLRLLPGQDLRAALDDLDIVVCDVGAHKVWLSRLYPAYAPNTVIVANGFAPMGIAVPGAIAGCIRVLIDWNTAKTQREIRHAFLHRAKELRPAWAVEV